MYGMDKLVTVVQFASKLFAYASSFLSQKIVVPSADVWLSLLLRSF